MSATLAIPVALTLGLWVPVVAPAATREQAPDPRAAAREQAQGTRAAVPFAAAEPGPDAAIQAADQQPDPEANQLEVAFTVYARQLPTAPQSVTVIDRQTIEASGARTVGDLLRTVAGVHPLGTGVRGGSNAALIRGGDPNFTVVLVDGVPVNDATDQLGGAVNLETYPVAAVERIEVVRGPMSFFYGSAALGGVINIVTRRGGAGRPLADFEVGVGDASLWRGSAILSGAGGGADYALGVQFEREDGRIAADDFEDLRAHGKLGLSLGDESELLVSTFLGRWQADDYPETSGGPELGDGALRHSDVDELSLAAELRFATGPRRAHKLAAYYFRRTLERASPAIFPLVPASSERTGYHRLRVAAAATLWAPPSARLVGGLDVDHDRGDSDSLLRLTPVFGFDVPASYSLSRTTTGGYLELSTGRGGLLLEAGIRLDASEDAGLEWSPRVGVGYRLGDGRTRVRSTVGRAFKLPSFFALGTPPLLGGNPDLGPESGIGLDAGVEHALAGLDLEVDGSVFYSRYRDLIDFDFESFRLVNRSEVESYGAELAVDWRPVAGLTTGATLTWNRVHDLTTGEPMLHRPEWYASWRLGWQPDPSLDVWTDVRLVSESFDRQLPVPDRDSVAGYGLVGLAAAWHLDPDWRLQVRLDNLTDTDYEHFIGFPGPGPSVVAGLRYKLR